MAGVPDAAVGFLLENLKEFVAYNADLIAGAEDNAKSLCDELEVLRGYLKHCTEEYSNNDFPEKLAEDVQKLVYRAEDAIETYMTITFKQKSRGSFKSALYAIDHAMELRNIGKEVEAIKQEVHQLYKTKVNQPGFQAIQVDKGKGDEQRVEKAPRMTEDIVVGLDDQVETLINSLMNGELGKLGLISIIGTPGIGKTTLAKKILNDPRIEYEFYPRVFLRVSEEYQREEMFLKILGSFTPISEEMTKMPVEIESIVEIIREKLEIKKYLIVLDDIWTSNVWDDLKEAFPCVNGSRVLITSRFDSVAHDLKESVARDMKESVAHHPKCKPYHLGFLNEHESRELLRRKVFGENTCPIDELETYESDVLSRCGGLPLAIAIAGGILSIHPKEIEWWMQVVKGLDDSDARNLMENNELIRLSFNCLPYHLKPCFLYTGVFRKYSEIPVRTLLQLWIAEGFVQQVQSMTLEEIAEDYLKELIDRNLVTVEKRRSNGQIKTCRVHDILHTFSKVQAKKENLFEEITKLEQSTDSSVSAFSTDEYRRLCINSHVMEYIRSKLSGKYVRSFLSFAEKNFILPLEYISSVPKAFKLLKVLDIRPIKFCRFPAELYYLVLLKYMAMSCDLRIIPEKVSYLRNLQTLIIETSQHVLEIKANIWRMKQLRHLYASASTNLLSVGEEPWNQENFQTLSTISPECCRKEVFEKTPKLKKLGIRGKLETVKEANGESNFFDSLAVLESLENLKIVNDGLFPTLQFLPGEEKFPRNLKCLTLINTLLDWSQMCVLGKLKYLEVLKLKDNAFQGESWRTEHGGFHRLQVLLIGRTNLAFWEASASDFPVLRSLALRYCTELKAIPPSFGDIVSLQNIDLYCTNGVVASSARKIQLLKLEELVEQSNSKSSGFRLSVYPPDL